MDLFHVFESKVVSDLLGLKLTEVTSLLAVIFAITYAFVRIVYDAFKKLLGAKIITKIQYITQPTYARITNNNSYDVDELFKGYSYVLDNPEGITYDPRSLLYSLRIVFASKGLIDYEILDYLDVKSINITSGNKDKQLMPLIKKAGLLVYNNQQYNYLLQDYHLTPNTTCYNRFVNLFSKDNFGLLTSGVVKGDIAFVIMVASGATMGAVYEPTVYLECIEIISTILQSKKRKLGLKNLDLAEFMVRLVSFLLPNEKESKLMCGTLGFSLELIQIDFLKRNQSEYLHNCIYHNPNFVKNDFDIIEDECYEYLKFRINNW
jgi:hypothetical protein